MAAANFAIIVVIVITVVVAAATEIRLVKYRQRRRQFRKKQTAGARASLQRVGLVRRRSGRGRGWWQRWWHPC
jgi:hypothetical protein